MAQRGRGYFLTLEGIDGSGKSTQARLLEDWLTGLGRTVLRTFEPGDTELGAGIRTLLLHSGDVDPRAEALLYAADRAQHVATLVRPALERGEFVIQDRYTDSSVAYQAGGRVLSEDTIRRLSAWATDDLQPDMTVLLDLPVEAAQRRMVDNRELDRMERERLDFHARVRERYLRLGSQDIDRVLVIDATMPPEDIQQRIRFALLSRIPSLEGAAEAAEA